MEERPLTLGIQVALGPGADAGEVADAALQRSWLSRSQSRSIKLELGGDVLELTEVSSAEQRRLADEWLQRQQRR